jgi:hypothetical protein
MRQMYILCQKAAILARRSSFRLNVQLGGGIFVALDKRCDTLASHFGRYQKMKLILASWVLAARVNRDIWIEPTSIVDT